MKTKIEYKFLVIDIDPEDMKSMMGLSKDME